jgi:hypothetical protein
MTDSRGTERGTCSHEAEGSLSLRASKGSSNNNLQSSWGETRTPDPGIMRDAKKGEW